MSDKTFEMTMLLDFYGELLTKKQRDCVNLHYNEDLSLSEIAEIMSISRQGVHDLLLRSEANLRNAEEKIGLIGRFSKSRAIAENMSAELKALEGLTEGEAKKLVLSLQKELEEINL